MFHLDVVVLFLGGIATSDVFDDVGVAAYTEDGVLIEGGGMGEGLFE